MTKAITVRLDDEDHATLTQQATQLRVQPGTLARMLIHGALTSDTRAQSEAALNRLIQRSRKSPSADVVSLIADARTALGEE